MITATTPRFDVETGSPDDPSVELRDVRKLFGSVVAVDGVSLTVRPGEFVTLLGPSGCGKTTTLRMIGGFEYPTSGAVLIHGQEMGGLPPYRRPVNTVFQNYALFPHMTVAQNVGYGLEMARVPREERTRRVAQALEMVRLPQVEKRKPSELSGGQQQRVALARALVNRPAVLLLDEPLGALDLKLRKAMQLELKALNREVGATFIYVTHDQEEALTMSDRIAVMSEGRILQLGTPNEIYERPRNRFVADFIGQTNFLDGTLVRVDGEIAEVELAGSGVVRGRVPSGETPIGTVTVAVRPERVSLGSDFETGVIPRAWNSLSGTVADVIYLGTHRQVVVALPGGGAVTVHRQNRTGGDGGPQPGENAVVVFDPAGATILAG
ncbi:MAG: spermidine/putrescine transport system ATP-binding protein [Thermomicrobiales bacterium]|nr:spermidine/putrescine transport system ATP-binding protein [Thermomicrobiales bacterium]